MYPVLMVGSDTRVMLLDSESMISVCVTDNVNGIGLTLKEAQILHQQLGQIVYAAELLKASEQETRGKDVY